MPINTQGGINIAALTVPDLYINVQPPPSVALNGVPADIIGIVGTAPWGPVDSPVILGSLSDYSVAFGTVQARKFDAGTAVAICQLQGANNFRVVRHTDGTDAAATAVVQTNCITLTGKYTGSRGNLLQATFGPGTAPSTTKVTLALPQVLPEVFDNIAGTGNALWIAIAAAINNGQSAIRGPSQIAVASAGVGTTAPAAATVTLAGGLDGAAVTAAQLIGADTSPRTGMYALRGTGCALFMLADCDTSSTWSTQLAFGLSEVCEAVAVSAPGDTVATFTTNQTNDNPWLKVIFGDWVFWLDSVNNVVRLVSPQAFYAGMKAALGPHQSALNKPLLGVVGTQKSYLNQTYSTAELTALAAARGDVVANPSPGGNYWAFRFGRNTSSDPGRHQDSYTTLTDFIATTIQAGAGKFVGRLATPTEVREATSSISGFLQLLKENDMIQAFSVVVTIGQPGTGTQKAVVQVQYFDTVEYFIVDLTGGASVQIQSLAQAA
jgi:phage tail sheath protein FI